MRGLVDLAIGRNGSIMTRQWYLSDITRRLQTQAAKCLLEKLVWYDLMGMVSTGAQSLLSVDHSILLETDSIDMQEVSGCPNAILGVLREITILRGWKTQAEREKRLSIIELAVRGNKIVEKLQEMLSDLDLPVSAHEDGSHQDLQCGQPNHQTSASVASIYARAALVFVHVVISGPNIYIQELRTEVASLTDRMRSMSQRLPLRTMLWPLCVAVCLAEGASQQSAQKMIEESEGSQDHSFRAVICAVSDLATVCQKSRDETQEHLCWQKTMDRLQKHVLLA